eukprot:3947380-Pleurochrysis_carterae.AAC.1
MSSSVSNSDSPPASRSTAAVAGSRARMESASAAFISVGWYCAARVRYASPLAAMPTKELCVP